MPNDQGPLRQSAVREALRDVKGGCAGCSVVDNGMVEIPRIGLSTEVLIRTTIPNCPFESEISQSAHTKLTEMLKARGFRQANVKVSIVPGGFDPDNGNNPAFNDFARQLKAGTARPAENSITYKVG